MHIDLDMGRYAFYVWGAYGASALGLGGLIVTTLMAHARRKKVLAALQEASK